MIDAKGAKELLHKALDNQRKLASLETGWHRAIVEAAERGQNYAVLQIQASVRGAFKTRMQELGFNTKQEDIIGLEAALAEFTSYRVMW